MVCRRFLNLNFKKENNIMKLLMENWRQYLDESEKAQDYGYLYLFEGDTVRQTSFYDAMHLLSENENAIETFLENWERSVDYHIEQLDEGAMADMANNPVLYLSTQAFMFMGRIKDKVAKYAAKLIGIVNKIKNFAERFKEKHPTIYKIGAFAAQLIIAIITLYILSAIFGSSEAQAGDLVGGSTYEGGDIVQKVIASEEELRKLGEAASNVEGLEDIGQEILNIANNPEDVEGGVGSAISRKVSKVIVHGVGRLRELDAQKLADAAAAIAEDVPDIAAAETVTQVQMGNAPLQALNALAGAASGDQSSIELLQKLQGQLPALQGVDVTNLSSDAVTSIAKAIRATL
jgi:hypothetical protein